MPVWDRPVRLLHWLLAAAAVACWLTSVRWHEWAGYLAGAAALARLAWGFRGRGPARFSAFVRSPSATLRYVALLVRGRAPRYLGHNPLGGWMIVVLLATTIVLAATGWLYVNTDAFWGDPVVEALHVVLGWGLLALVAVHVLAVLAMGRRHGDNLIRSMVNGRKAVARGRAAAGRARQQPRGGDGREA